MSSAKVSAGNPDSNSCNTFKEQALDSFWCFHISSQTSRYLNDVTCSKGSLLIPMLVSLCCGIVVPGTHDCTCTLISHSEEDTCSYV